MLLGSTSQRLAMSVQAEPARSVHQLRWQIAGIPILLPLHPVETILQSVDFISSQELPTLTARIGANYMSYKLLLGLL